MGSDHCPVVLSAIVQLPADASSRATAALCARNFVEFAGKQQGITAFLSRHPSDVASASTESTPSTTPPGARKRPRTGSSKPKQPSIASFFVQSASATTSRATPASSSVKRRHVFTTQRQTTTTHTHSRGADTANGDDVDIPKLLRALEAKERAAASWRQVLSGAPPKTPLCFCAQPTVLRTVLKTNDNWGRKFYVCTKPEVRCH